MPDVFISYSHTDREAARRFGQGFVREGLSIWWDVTIEPGTVFDTATERALEDSKAVVVLWSRSSVDSRWVRAEATAAERDGKLLPVMIEACKRPIQFELTHTLDLSDWNGSPTDPRWQELLAAVRRCVSRTAPHAPSPGTAVAAATVETAPAGARPRTPKTNTRRWLVPGALAVLAAAAGIGWKLLGSADTLAHRPAAAADVIPLAVLPFVNLSPDPDQEFFCDGLSEEILNQLAQIRGLRVTGRTSSFSFKGQNEDLRVIARKLGVDKLLEGSIRKEGDNVRITAQLIDGVDGGHLFSRTYDRRLDEVFTVQEEVAKDVAQALSITLDVGEWSRASGGTNNLDAFDRYQRARDAFLRQGGAEGFLRAEPLLREAVSIDPGFTRAWLQLAWLIQSPRAPARPPAEADAILREASERVMALAPGSWESNVVRAYELVRQRNWIEADALATATFLERPMTATTLEKASIYGQLRTFTGRLTDSIVMYATAIQLEPRSLVISGDRQFLLTSAGRFEEAEAEYQRTMDLPGEHGSMHYLAFVRALASGEADPTRIHGLLGRVWGDEGQWPDYVRHLAAALPDRRAARAAVRAAFESGDLQTGGTYFLGDALGDTDLAMTALDGMRNAGAPANLLPLWAAPNSGVRAHPRFKEILRETGLADFYRATGEWGDFCRPLTETDFECG